MADAQIFYDELRFDVRDGGATDVYCYIRGEGDCPHVVIGWHYKQFPADIPSQEIMAQLWNGEKDNDPIYWERRTPPNPDANHVPEEALFKIVDEATKLFPSGSVSWLSYVSTRIHLYLLGAE